MKFNCSLALATCLALAAFPVHAKPAPNASQILDQIRADPLRLEIFMRAFPKGADLHNHLSGAIYAENMLRWAGEDGLCVSTEDGRILDTPCGSDIGAGRMAASTLPSSEAAQNRMIDALSMRDFVPSPGDRSGHDHFFAAFARFAAAQRHHEGDMLAEAMARAGRDHITYVEFMVSPQVIEVSHEGLSHPLTGEDFSASFAALSTGIPAIVKAASAQTDAMEKSARATLGCGTQDADPGCDVHVRYLFQSLRIMQPSAVFAQLVLGYALVKADPRFVGVNIVAPEDDPVALRDYSLHMRMFHFLSTQDPDVKLSLHAGELALGLVPTEELRSHIRQAVEIAGASRIGHGVDIAFEDDTASLLAEMARRHVMVEINLTSNDGILGIKGSDHPFSIYRAAGVPVALSTDDEGVSRSDLTHEYVRAATTWPLHYGELKDLSRTGIEYGFVPGASLWASTQPFVMVPACRGQSAIPSASCREFLGKNEKAALQWELETRFASFEQQIVKNPLLTKS